MGKKRKKKTIKEDKTMENINEVEVKEAEKISEIETSEQVENTSTDLPFENKPEEFSNNVVENNTIIEESQNDTNVLIKELDEFIKVKTGKLVGCVKLNLRKEPDSNSEVVKILTENDGLGIDELNSTDDFYKVTTADGYEGYCMRDYVEIA